MDSNITELAQRLKDARRVVYLCGAGLSVPSGIRAYRSGPKAIWSENVMAWGTAQKFHDDPAAWWSSFWLEAHGDLFRDFKPNAGHVALAKAMKRSSRDLVITQNIDGLHRLAGHPEEQLIEIHGRHDRFICAGGAGCEGIDHPVSSVDLSRVKEGVIPKCAKCDAPMRPLVLLFDEHYDSHADFQAWRGKKALNDADVLVFVGTSFSVGITSYAVRCADVSGALTINVNVEPAPFAGMINLIGGAEELLPRLVTSA
jgi:NAD-dependent deacetylase